MYLTLPRQAAVVLASRRRRFHHYLWHRVRNSWAGMPSAQQQAVRDINPAPQWDALAYDYLGDTYSSRVNPIFWRLLGWVNERVEDWKRAASPGRSSGKGRGSGRRAVARVTNRAGPMAKCRG